MGVDKRKNTKSKYRDKAGGSGINVVISAQMEMHEAAWERPFKFMIKFVSNLSHYPSETIVSSAIHLSFQCVPHSNTKKDFMDLLRQYLV